MMTLVRGAGRPSPGKAPATDNDPAASLVSALHAQATLRAIRMPPVVMQVMQTLRMTAPMRPRLGTRTLVSARTRPGSRQHRDPPMGPAHWLHPLPGLEWLLHAVPPDPTLPVVRLMPISWRGARTWSQTAAATREHTAETTVAPHRDGLLWYGRSDGQDVPLTAGRYRRWPVPPLYDSAGRVGRERKPPPLGYDFGRKRRI